MMQRCPRKGACLYHDVLPGALYPGTATSTASTPAEQNRGSIQSPLAGAFLFVLLHGNHAPRYCEMHSQLHYRAKPG